MDNLLQSKKFKIILIAVALILIALLVVVFVAQENGNDAAGDEGDDYGLETITEDRADYLDEDSSSEDEGDQVFYLSKDEVTGFGFTDGHGIYLPFEFIDGSWIYTDDETMSVRQDRVESVLNYLTDIRCVATINAESGDEYGLSQDSQMAVINDISGNEIIISFGSYDEDSGHIYFAMNYDFTVIYENSGKLHRLFEYYAEDLME